MVKKGFPKFGMSQAGAYVTALKNYNLPDFILKLVAKDTDSELLERGRIDDRLQSMNDDALELLNRIFVECEEDKKGKYAQYRFFAYVSSMYHKCEVLINETIPGKSGKDHKIPIAIVYATWSGLGIFTIAMLGYIFYKQTLSWQAILGLFLIVIGVVLVNSFTVKLN